MKLSYTQSCDFNQKRKEIPKIIDKYTENFRKLKALPDYFDESKDAEIGGIIKNYQKIKQKIKQILNGINLIGLAIPQIKWKSCRMAIKE